ncbi:aldo-keto reductase-like protein [Polyplosphaeria fusca]|uniref:Aldo-keto reductase-like protein n=1 Tax=Polyplosphaeria fusca TaxID=682080 RepID=A0A9P4R326_9PLEO|nr:aldo-keto reductase-like protein [Polyplosphaeria fusca]
MSSATAQSRLLSGDSEPAFIYGTAWKKDTTSKLVQDAIRAGFRAIDTAAQPRHYQEDLVGEGLRQVYKDGLLKRGDLYIQTKYTTPAGQDMNRMPYHPLDPLETQIQVSVASSLNNLRPNEDDQEGSYLDCLLLHSPLPTIEQTILAWKILESYVPNKIRALGISNVTLPVLQAINDNATVKPSVVQNRFYPATKYNMPLRAFCREHSIKYQSFWTLTGNPNLLRSETVRILADSAKVSTSIALYALVMDLGVVVLNGTTSTDHMDEDLSGIQAVKKWAMADLERWYQIRAKFQRMVEP